MTTTPVNSDSRVVVGVDGSPQSEQALQWSAQIAALLRARLDVVSAWDYPQPYGWAAVVPDGNPGRIMEKIVSDTTRAVFGDQLPPGTELHVREGGAAKVLQRVQRRSACSACSACLS